MDHGAPAHALPATEAFFDRQSILAHRPPHIPSLGSNAANLAHDHQQLVEGRSPTLPSMLSPPYLLKVDEQRPSPPVTSPRQPGMPQHPIVRGRQLSMSSFALPLPSAVPAAGSKGRATGSDTRGSTAVVGSVQAAVVSLQTGHSLDTAMSGILRARMRSLRGDDAAINIEAAAGGTPPAAAAPVHHAAALEAVSGSSQYSILTSSTDAPQLTQAASPGKAAVQQSVDQVEVLQGAAIAIQMAETRSAGREVALPAAQRGSMLARIPSDSCIPENNGPGPLAECAGSEDDVCPASLIHMSTHAEQPQRHVSSADVGRAWQQGSPSPSPAQKKLRRWTMIMVPSLQPHVKSSNDGGTAVFARC